MRFNNDKYRSLNESIAKVQNPHTALQEAMEYAAALEAVVLDICEKLDLDPDALVEDVMTAARQKEHQKKLGRLYTRRRKDYKAAVGASSDRAAALAGDQFDRIDKKTWAARDRYRKELESKKLYGKGGKVLKRKPGKRDVARGSSKDKH
jgi:hypothetical protein